MCTATLRLGATDTLVTMNRDESPKRAPELPPTIMEANGVRWVGPLDSAAGGTWIGGSEHGVVAWLLNGYAAADYELMASEAKPPSRGHIIPMLFAQGNCEHAASWLLTVFDPTPYASFDLAVVGRGTGLTLRWRIGEAATISALKGGWSGFYSSGWEIEETLRHRAELFARWREGGENYRGLLPALHLDDQEPEKGPLMERGFSRTRSITQIALGPEAVEVRHWPRPDGGAPAVEPTTSVRLPLLVE